MTQTTDSKLVFCALMAFFTGIAMTSSVQGKIVLHETVYQVAKEDMLKTFDKDNCSDYSKKREDKEPKGIDLPAPPPKVEYWPPKETMEPVK